MPVVILALALFLLMAGLGGFLTGFSLLPTDVGRAWLVAGATMLSGGVVSLVIGFGVGKLVQALAAGPRAAQAEDEAPVQALSEAAPSAPLEPPAPAAPEPVLAEPALAEPTVPAPETAKPRFRLPGMAAAGGALLGAGAGMAARLSPKRETTPPPESEDPEKDLFADIDTLRGEDMSNEADASVALKASEASAVAAPPLPTFDLRPEIAPVQAESALPEAPEEQPAPEVAEPEPPAAPVPGLIADDDLAALAFDTPPLAPLNTLDVVGAYDSGGVRFTMYSDGSVNAVGPGGERRFPTLEALRKHLDSGQSAV